MNKLRPLIKNLKPADFIVIAFYLLLTIGNLLFPCKVKSWYGLVFFNAVVIGVVISIANLHAKYNYFIFRQLHLWYFTLLTYITFKEVYMMIKPICENDYDNLLIRADRWLFGFDPTVELFKIANPLLTEILQIAYSLFYFLPIILGMALYLNKRYLDSDYVIFSVVYGFLLSYLAYFILPAVGPRFTLHNFATTNDELPGLFLTNFLREIINSGESIPKNTFNPIAYVQRDVFPSGHTMMTAMVMFLAIRLKSNSKYYLCINGMLLIFATVYLRYHYAIDLFGGLVLTVFSLWTGKMIFNGWQKKLGKEEFSYPKW